MYARLPLLHVVTWFDLQEDGVGACIYHCISVCVRVCVCGCVCEYVHTSELNAWAHQRDALNGPHRPRGLSGRIGQQHAVSHTLLQRIQVAHGHRCPANTGLGIVHDGGVLPALQDLVQV